ncbi:MAG: choice-of-anchor D domain-containing protein [Candidatus Eisenbacteria bacterium]|uniref:Choice-of-anchor D domain-containing protein n=1 Tax=Eiseniibacteriota bacterium TaxID=2212470 RepID=A0A849T265_UNCEI|nr:choice-of-anchor D domain-containing protein [Candidatus Eisenbacteria bacterium]
MARFGMDFARRGAGLCTLALAAATLIATPAHALRVVTWNLLNYGPLGNTVTPRQAAFRTVMEAIDADVVILQELKDSFSADSFVTNVLNVVEPGEWATSGELDVQSAELMAVCWKPARLAVSNVAVLANAGPRDMLQALIKPVGTRTNAAWFRLYGFHLKAGQTAPDSTTRRLECADIRAQLNTVNPVVVGSNFVIGGDSNFYGAFEGGYIRLTESQADNDGRCKDFISLSGDWGMPTYAPYHTQAPCSSCPVYSPSPGFSGGGMDDRFDILLSSYSLQDGLGMDVINTFAYGQDGLHYNSNINGAPTNSAVGQTIANALWATSDHLPVVMDLRLPSDIASVAPVAFGDVLIGASAAQNLVVANAAVAPADALDYSIASPAGFSAPAGPFSGAAGSPPNNHAVTMDTASPGTRNGDLVLTTDAPDSATVNVPASGRVLAHAVASLDSGAVVQGDTLDFGALPASFPDLEARIHNRGYVALQARLAVSGAVITGGAGHFSIVGGFTPLLLAGVGHSLTLHFDDTNSTADSTYEATLTISSGDEALPGAAAQPDLTVLLRAQRTGGATGVGGEPAPAQLALLAPRPNPARGAVELGFDLPRRAAVDLAIFDLGGRRVATLASGSLEAARHRFRWDGRDLQGGRAPAGLYFVRLTALGHSQAARLVVLN